MFGIFFLSLIFSACKKGDEQIQYVFVDFEVSLNDPQFIDLQAVGGWVYVTGGVRGIVIYRKNTDEFLAYERNCPYRPGDDCARCYVMNDNVTVKDDCCGSLFSIMNGSILGGQATRPLKQYKAEFLSPNIRITN